MGRDDDPVIRLLDPTDSLEELTDLLHRAYARLAEAGLRYVATYQTVDTTRARIADAACFVAVAGGRLVGTATFRDAGHSGGCPYYDRPDVATLHMFAVDPEMQGRGIGARLIQSVEDRARATGAAELALDTAEQATHLIDMYARWGYRLVEHAQWSVTNYRSVILSKRLEVGLGGTVPG